jgi:1,4-alpha-glucan branching enzyme
MILSTNQQTKKVQFRCSAAGAKSVTVVGTFNNWNPAVTPLRKARNGDWSATVSLPPGRYEYRFVVDGEWRDDTQAGEFVSNPHGGRNAVVSV